MSEFKPIKCPSCGGQLQIPTDRESVSCMYCGTKILIEEALSKNNFDPKNYLELANTEQNSGNYDQALVNYNKCLEHNPKDENAWFGKAICTLYSSKRENLKIDDAISYFNKYFDVTKKDKKENIDKVISEIEKFVESRNNDFITSNYISIVKVKEKNKHSVFQDITTNKNELIYLKDNSVKMINLMKYAENLIESDYEKQIAIVKKLNILIKQIKKAYSKFPNNVDGTSSYYQSKTKQRFSSYLNTTSSLYLRKQTYLENYTRWIKNGRIGKEPKMPRMTNNTKLMIGLVIIIIFMIGLCSICTGINSCNDNRRKANKRREVERLAFVQDSTEKARISDSLLQIENYNKFLDSLKVNNPDSFRILFIIESLKIESLDQIRIQDSIRQVFIQDSIAKVQRQDSINEERRFRDLKGKMKIEFEESISTFWIKHNNSPRYVNSRNFMCYPYFGLKSSLNKWLRLKIGCNRSDWLFINKITIKIDEVENDIPIEYADLNQSVEGQGVTEWVDLNDKENLIRRISTASEVWIIYWGTQGRESYKLTTADLQVFKEIVEFYDMCGKSEFATRLR